MLRLVYLFALFALCYSAEVAVKNLAGPPSDFSQYTLPSPVQSADVQNSAAYNVDLSPSLSEANVLTQTLTLLVDSDMQFGFTFYSPNDDSITLSLVDPKGNAVRLVGNPTYFPFGDMQVQGTEYSFKHPKTGAYVLTIQTSTLSQELYNTLTTNSGPDAYVVLWNEDALSTHTYLNTYSLLTGSQVGLVTRVFNTTFSTADMQAGKVPEALRGSVEDAVMSVMLPDGSTVTESMKDDGMSNDGDANDGVFGALITASAAGQYVFSATVRGANGNVNYVRTTQQLVTVIEPTLTLSTASFGSLDETSQVMLINIPVNAPVGNKYKAYAEVYGTDANGNSLAVAWVGGMAYVQANPNQLSLQLDLNWISRVNAQEPFSLQNVVIQDPQTFVPIAQADSMPIKTTFSVAQVMASKKDSLIGLNGEITPEMLEGRMPARIAAKFNATAQATIVLVHGYCSEVNPWTVYASDWTNAQFFLNPSANLPHDDFALMVLDWADAFGAFSYVGHSQGGAVGAHLKNFYWSGLDLVTGGRLLQSVGTPYQGSSGAGTAADLAKLFGVLCGANQDLTKDGSSLWLKGVTAQTRALVYYYTTTYVQGKLFGDYCNLATNLVLKWPNDGVAELELSQLPNAQNQGNTEGWCHSPDMKYTAQTQNRDRNKLMNSAAARQIKN
jgi:pimeloyl-ACP methyl ester carboxylesterase